MLAPAVRLLEVASEVQLLRDRLDTVEAVGVAADPTLAEGVPESAPKGNARKEGGAVHGAA